MQHNLRTGWRSVLLTTGAALALSGVGVAGFGTTSKAAELPGGGSVVTPTASPTTPLPARLELKAWVNTECVGTEPSATVRVKNRNFSTQRGKVTIMVAGRPVKKLLLRPSAERSMTWTTIKGGAVVKAVSYGVVLDQAKVPATCD